MQAGGMERRRQKRQNVFLIVGGVVCFLVFYKMFTNKPSSGHDSTEGVKKLEGPRVLLITASQPGCPTKRGDYVTMRALKNKMDYAHLHNMDVFFSLERYVDGPHRVDGLHNKIFIINNTMTARPNYDWYIWMDADTIIADMDFEIPWSNYVGKSLVLWGKDANYDTVVKEPNYLGINSGVVFFRNTRLTQSLFQSMKKIWVRGFNEAFLILSRVVNDMPPYASDQSTLMYLLATQPEKWRAGTQFILGEYSINFYWKQVNLESYYRSGWIGDGTSPPFLVHYCGCELCWIDNENTQECLNHFDRVYNFADDQVLARMGLRHENLSSPVVTRAESPLWYKGL